ncbi:ankyrin repeat-containing domain protein [Fusarium oxysporum f. sp. albedinis]|nr:ankyrin repeat-containing domain protein [Fusarium oxysporum f. sp. albedinis]
MSDPVSVAGSAVGIISLGITVAQGLFDYYAAFQGQNSDVACTAKKLARLLEMLENLRDQLERRQFRADDHGLPTNMKSSMEDCKELVRELEEVSSKFNQVRRQGTVEGLHAAGRRAAYPFRQSTLQKLDEDVDDFVSCLSLAMQVLQQNDSCKVQDDIEDTKALLDLTRASQVPSHVRARLKAPDATINFNEAAKKKHPGTGLWFVNGPAFTSWLKEPDSFLWLVGSAGCGKSVLCSTAIQYAFRHRRANPRIGIAFFYFTFSDGSKQDGSAMLRALVLQLASQLDNRHSPLSLKYDGYHSTPPGSALMDRLHRLIRAFENVYIVLDALDESPRDKHREAMLQVLTDLRAWSEPGLHLIVSSRDEVDIRQELGASPEQTIKMKNESIDQDIASYISHRLRDNRRLLKWDECHARIETALTTRAQGVFCWVVCQFKVLESCPQREDLLDQLLESLPRTLDETYERMLSNIPSSSKDYARQMLTLLCCAKRPLSVAELIDGIAVQLDGTPRFNPKRNLKDVDAIQQVCPGFTELEVNPTTGETTVRIAHFSVREYLGSEQIRNSKDAALFSVRQEQADAQMARICLTALLEPRLAASGSASSRLQQDNFALAHYAARYWPGHFRDGLENAQTDVQVLRLFKRREGLFEKWVAIWNVDEPAGEAPLGKIAAPLYYASLLGLESIVPLLLDVTAVAALPPTGYYGSALQAASADGHDKTVQLIENNADVNAEGGRYGSALRAASAGGHYKIVQLLIENNADVNAQGGLYGSALQGASEQGHDKIVQLLIENNADVNARCGYYGSALKAASAEGHEKIVQLLIDKNADVNAKGGAFGSALQAVSVGGHEKIVQLLIDNNADVNAQGGHYGSALHAASAGGHDKIVQLLIENNADVNVNAQVGPYGNALQAASAEGHEKIVQLLLDNNADVNAKRRGDGSALQAASAGGHDKIVQLLIENNADVNAQGGEYGSALQVASGGGHEKIVQLLIDNNADVKAEGGSFGSALQAASEEGHDKIVQLLIDNNADDYI